jgi:type IV secretory pathway VirB10-like protein
MAALILATVFSLVYFVSTQRTGPAPAAVSGASIGIPPAELPSPSDANQAVPPPAMENSETAAAVSEQAKEETKKEAKKASMTAPPAVKKSSSKTTERKPAEEAKKDDSKVGSILKKTGRILKKPFKF